MSNPPRPLPRLVALQHRDFRLIWGGQMISTIGTQMQSATVDWHIAQLLEGVTYTVNLFGTSYDLRADALGLGTVGLARFIPIVTFALIGGMMADSFNRRKIMMYTHTAAAIFAGILAALTLTGSTNLIAIYLLTGAIAASAAFDNPARQSLVPNLVPTEHVTNAVSLNTLNWQIGMIVGPALSGLIIGFTNIGVIYAINAVSYLAVLVALLLMRYRGENRAATTVGGFGWQALLDGLRFVLSSRIILSTMMLDFFATFFSSARSMMPLVARDVLNLGPFGYGLLRTADAVGATIAGSILSLRKEIHHQGAVLLISVMVYGLATVLFGLSDVFILSYIFFSFTGAADTVSTVIRVTLRQLMTPDHLRGRMTAFNMIFFMGGPQLGELEAGLVAARFGVPFSIISGGIATLLFAGIVAWRYPRLRHFTADQYSNPHLS